MKYTNFNDAIEEAKRLGKKRQLLLGNGFSIGCHESFKYGTLFEQAKKAGLPSHLEELLTRHGNHFEEVLKYLDEGEFLTNLYELVKKSGVSKDMREDYERLKNLLVKTIGDNHPDHPSKIPATKFVNCLNFLRNFDAIFTVNYDLLLYWTSLHIDQLAGQKFPFLDGFCLDEDPKNPDCSFSYSSMGTNKPYLFFLHGALHLYTKEGNVWKRVWSTTAVPIITQVREAFEKKEYPLFVAEGFFIDKMKKTEASSYLYQAYRKFKNIEGHLFIYGHSLSNQDEHLLQAIIHSWKLQHLWIGLYGNPELENNKAIIQKALSMQSQRDKILPQTIRKKEEGDLQIAFFDSESAKVWG